MSDFNEDSLITTPEETTGMFDTDYFTGSIQQILSDNIGKFVIIEFLIGTGSTVRKQGILYFVDRDYLVLQDVSSSLFVICDIFSIKFVNFPFSGPQTPPNQVRNQQSMPVFKRR